MLGKWPGVSLINFCQPVCILCVHQELECVPYCNCTTSYRELIPCPSSQNVPRLTYSQSCHHCSAAELWGHWSRGTMYERTLFPYFNIIQQYFFFLQPSVFSVKSALSVWRNESNDTKCQGQFTKIIKVLSSFTNPFVFLKCL